jgi:hypothetical protein
MTPTQASARAHGLIVLTLAGDKICAITRFSDNSLLPTSSCPALCLTSQYKERENGSLPH